jgi:hypothetical protein
VPLLVLAVMAVTVFTLSTLRFRRDLAPADRHGEDAGGPGSEDGEAEAA